MRQGEVYWVAFGGRGSEPAGRRPAVVVQDDYSLSPPTTNTPRRSAARKR